MTKFLHFNVDQQTRHMSLKLRRKFQSRTLAADPPSADTVRHLATEYLKSPFGLTVELTVGVTLLSLKDRYNKETGRQEASKRMAPIQIGVAGVSMNDTHIFIHLQDYKGVKLGLRTNRKTGFTTVVGALVG